jgi:hypothetical protein
MSVGKKKTAVAESGFPNKDDLIFGALLLSFVFLGSIVWRRSCCCRGI